MFRELLLISFLFFNLCSGSNRLNFVDELYRNYGEEIRAIFNISNATEGLVLFNTSYVTVFPNKEAIRIQEETVDPFECLEWEQQFCTKVSNYPKLDKFVKLFESKYPQLKMFTDKNHVEDEIEKRMLPYKEAICNSRYKIIYPEAMHTNDGWLFIVNNEQYKQDLRIEECEPEDEQCYYEASNLPKGFNAVCKQHFIEKVLVAMTMYGDVITHHAQIPSCCKCIIEEDFSKTDL
uniref:Spaetzle domain-containing protein n=1 Tax=Glossina palpalis gambiensis TaxID=67801 RepID=A0A1B0BMK7_9MUSC